MWGLIIYFLCQCCYYPVSETQFTLGGKCIRLLVGIEDVGKTVL